MLALDLPKTFAFAGSLLAITGCAVLSTRNTSTQPEKLVVYKDLIHPIIEQNCLSCHNPDKLKGELNLESYAGYLKGGEMGPSVVPGELDDSELAFRISLPRHDDEAMPPEEKSPLSPDEIAVINWWIENGASPTATVGSYPSLPPAVDRHIATTLTSRLSPKQLAALEAERQRLYVQLSQTTQDLGIQAIPIAPSSNLFTLDTFSVQASFDNQKLQRLEPFAIVFVEADFSGTRLTDAALDTLSKFERLRSLNLSNTQIEGSSLGKLARIESLQSLNLYGSPLKNAHLEQLAQLKQLKRLHLFQTELYQAEAIEKLRSALPDCAIEFAGLAYSGK